MQISIQNIFPPIPFHFAAICVSKVIPSRISSTPDSDMEISKSKYIESASHSLQVTYRQNKLDNYKYNSNRSAYPIFLSSSTPFIFTILIILRVRHLSYILIVFFRSSFLLIIQRWFLFRSFSVVIFLIIIISGRSSVFFISIPVLPLSPSAYFSAVIDTSHISIRSSIRRSSPCWFSLFHIHSLSFVT